MDKSDEIAIQEEKIEILEKKGNILGSKKDAKEVWCIKSTIAVIYPRISQFPEIKRYTKLNIL
ncbi:2027_t:CDS:2 [Gigaspora margarita]|uniref:2027_t:CDS:1 n=1 Tax=Gigaspora margarita TaxID=4874 RepID=A0ABM8VVG0_GIGMA|nr:2027_t:CDS:2 [Gigaspora margarita]